VPAETTGPPPNPAVHRTAAEEIDCGVNVTEPPRPVTYLTMKPWGGQLNPA
jgi:hypothetical protein